eukprot:CAMPEP_0181024358 /NCGR_PEP_ID=MMETSP1070-20121207/2530_1 /TAXON_ID=265543 /ORGANISM="Minutocellus polymorphus, Strain NH13" /LENGTH=575 /DNA_ID=CAMNT_0023101411 /DNA_START=319 /DNA_END=2046 /DNA_ORIENTATION=-
MARLGAGTSIHPTEVVASSSVVTAAAPDITLDDILAGRQLGSKSSKSKSKSKSSKSKSSKKKSSKKKSSKKKSSKKKKKKSSVFNKGGDSSSKSKKNKSSSSSSSSKKKSSSSSKKSDKKKEKKSSSDEKRKDSSKSDAGKNDKKSSSDEKRKDSSKSDNSKNNKAPEMGDITKEVVSILKDRKNVVNGKDKTKALDQKDLRNKVLDELDIKDSDRGEAKKMFDDAIEKLEKKDEIKLDGDGDVKIFVSMDESDSDDKKKKSESIDLSDVTKEVVSILKDRKKVVDGEDKTKTLDQKKLRDKVLDELDVRDSDRGEAKDLFEEALKKLEKKDEIKVDNDGDVKIVVSMDHSKESRSSDEKEFRSSNAGTSTGIFGQATIDDNSSEPSDINNVEENALINRPDAGTPTTDPSVPIPLDNGDSVIIIDQATSNYTETYEIDNDTDEGSDDPDSSGAVGDKPTGASNKVGIDSPTDVTTAGTNNIGDNTDSVANDAQNTSEISDNDSSTVDLSGNSNGSCGTGCKVGVSFAGVGLLVGIGSVAAKMAMAKKNEEDDDFESDEDEDTEGDSPAAAEEEV